MIVIKRRWLRLGAGILAAACLGVGGLIAAGVIQPFRSTVELAAFTERDVSVRILLEKGGKDGTRLTGIFTPVETDFHLYSKDLPRDGLEGIGRPTLLEIVSADGVRASGPLSVDQPEVENRVDLLNLSFPVYPEGTVNLHLPVELPAGDGAVTTELSVTYMACKGGVCLPPVIDKRISVDIPLD